MTQTACTAGGREAVGADVLDFGRGVELLRGPLTEAARERRLAIYRQGAYRRAVDGAYTVSDLGLCGPAEDLVRAGPGCDPRLQASNQPDVA